MFKISMSASNHPLSVILWHSAQTLRGHSLVNVKLDTLEMGLSIVQVYMKYHLPLSSAINNKETFLAFAVILN